MQKRMLCLALSTVFTIGTALAAPQDAPPAPPSDGGGRGPRQGMAMDPDRMVQQMTKQLNLSPDQATQIRPILADQVSQMTAIRSDSSLAPRDRMAKMMSLREESSTKIKAVLNPDQRTQFDAMQKQQMDRRMQQRGAGNGNGGAPPPPDGSNQ